METKRVESENALDILSMLNDYVWSFDWDKYSVTESENGFGCDTGGYSTERELENVSEVYWTLVNFAGDSKHAPNHHFAIEFTPKGQYGNLDRDYPVTVSILDNDAGEYTNRHYVIASKHTN